MKDTTVFLIDDDAAVRDSTALVLSLKGIRTQSFAAAETFLDTYQPEWFGCVLTDLRMPTMSGLELQQKMLERGIALPLVVLTAYGDVQTTRLAMKSGAFDFLEKPVDNEILVDVLTNALREDVLRRDAHRTEGVTRTLLERLTARERDVLKLLAEGLSQREVAARLAISPRTVEVYKSRMMEKLQCRTLADVVRFALAAAGPGQLES